MEIKYLLADWLTSAIIAASGLKVRSKKNEGFPMRRNNLVFWCFFLILAQLSITFLILFLLVCDRINLSAYIYIYIYYLLDFCLNKRIYIVSKNCKYYLLYYLKNQKTKWFKLKNNSTRISVIYFIKRFTILGKEFDTVLSYIVVVLDFLIRLAHW